jgi:pyruvate formate-lyase activating enzyme-like uncharacterized protein
MSKLNISPGCRLCRSGSWLCVYITRRCNRDCYFCSQKKLKKGDRAADAIMAYVSEEIRFDDIKEVVKYLKYWRLKGLGISGGEPLLVFDKVCRLISAAKKAIPGLYVWLYTNGDLATEKRLMRLRSCGLDELRFDLAARDYDLGPLRPAARIIDNVTVEIPALPKDKKKLIGLLGELKRIGVKYLNLHEMMVTRENSKKLAKAGITGNGSLETAEEVEAASRKRSRVRRAGLGVNICSLRYKKEEQTKRMIEHMRAVSKKVKK